MVVDVDEITDTPNEAAVRVAVVFVTFGGSLEEGSGNSHDTVLKMAVELLLVLMISGVQGLGMTRDTFK